MKRNLSKKGAHPACRNYCLLVFIVCILYWTLTCPIHNTPICLILTVLNWHHIAIVNVGLPARAICKASIYLIYINSVLPHSLLINLIVLFSDFKRHGKLCFVSMFVNVKMSFCLFHCNWFGKIMYSFRICVLWYVTTTFYRNENVMIHPSINNLQDFLL